MPAVVEVESGGTARIECNFYIPGNGSYTYINWFYVSADLGEEWWAVGWGGVAVSPGLSPRLCMSPALAPCLADRPQQLGEAVPHHGQRGPGGEHRLQGADVSGGGQGPLHQPGDDVGRQDLRVPGRGRQPRRRREPY